MSEIRENLVYSDDHEWALKVDGNVVRVGISDHAQCQLGDIVFVELPRPALSLPQVTASVPLSRSKPYRNCIPLFQVPSRK